MTDNQYPLKIIMSRGKKRVELTAQEFTRIKFAVQDVLDEKYKPDPTDNLHEEYKALLEKLRGLW